MIFIFYILVSAIVAATFEINLRTRESWREHVHMMQVLATMGVDLDLENDYQKPIYWRGCAGWFFLMWPVFFVMAFLVYISLGVIWCLESVGTLLNKIFDKWENKINENNSKRSK